MNSKTESTFELHQIHLSNGECFPCRSDESVLAAMRRCGIGVLTLGCFGGGCGVCAMRVVSGEYCRFHPMSRAHVTAEQEDQGQALMCCIKPLSDLSLDFRRDKDNN